MFKIILYLSIFYIVLLADEKVYISSQEYFNTKQYDKAFPLLFQEAKKGLKPSIYRLAYIYEHGLGTKVNYKKAMYWYKKLSKSYAYTVKSQSKQELLNAFSQQMTYKTNEEASSFAMAKIDTKTPETKALMNSIWEGNFFGLSPYHANYFLPLSMANSRYPRYEESLPPHATLTPLQEKYRYHKQTEVEFQISFKKQLSYNLFGWNEFIFFAFTQKAWFQIYEKSAPFREINYLPEIFIAIPSSESIDKKYGLKAIRLGLLHDSNGQDGYRSRSWNRIYVNGLWQWNNLFLASRVWYRIPEKRKSSNYYKGKGFNPDGTQIDPNETGDDNPHIQDYFGYGDLRVHYLYKKSQIGSLLRYNFGVGGTQRGAIELNYSYPFFNSKNMFWYAEFFNGYGESLIDYNRAVTKASIGFSFSRPLF